MVMEMEDKLILELLVDSGGIEMYITPAGKYKLKENLYNTFEAAFNGINTVYQCDLKEIISFLIPTYIDQEIRSEFAELINNAIENYELVFSDLSKRNWEIALNRKFYKKFYEKSENPEFVLTNIFGKEHTELHLLLEKLLIEYVDFRLLTTYLTPDLSELQQLCKQYAYSFNNLLLDEYVEKLHGWCIDVSENADPESPRPKLFWRDNGGPSLSSLKLEKEIFVCQTIKGSFLNRQTNQREILFKEYSILINEDTLKNLMEVTQEDGVKTYKPLYLLLLEKPNSYFEEANHQLDGVIYTDKVYHYISEFNCKKVYKATHVFDMDLCEDWYSGRDAFDTPELWRTMFTCFNLTLQAGIKYDTLLKYGYSHKEAMLISGLETETHLKLRTLLKEKYADKDDFDDEFNN